MTAVVNSFAPKARSKGVALVADIDSDIPAAVQGDPTRLQQILYNLVGNAIKFTSKGEVGLRVKKIDESLKDVRIYFAVKDTGIGIAPETKAELFKPFA